MPTLYKRFKQLESKNIISTSTKEQRAEIGKIVAQEYIKRKIKIPLTKVEIIEDGEPLKVLSYPRSFLPIIDNILIKYCAAAPPNLEKKKRKRIPIKTAVYISRLKKQ